MRVTGEHGVSIAGTYPRGLCGRSLLRRDFDAILLRHAIGAGAAFEPNVAVRSANVVERCGRASIAGVLVGNGRTPSSIDAAVTIAADGSRSTIAFGLGVGAHPSRPRRWAVGGYFADVAGTGTHGEMHIRRGHYVGIAPVPGGLTNVCVVRPSRAGDAELRDPAALLASTVALDPMLAPRFRAARLTTRPVVMGPLATEVGTVDLDGLLFAGDSAGFIDPMTGDGLRFAIRGGVLAAHAALQALEHGWCGVHHGLASARRREFAAKQRFNRALRSLVGSPVAVEMAALGARVAPAILRRVIARAGDCNVVVGDDGVTRGRS
jgi:flavin-dependent dehydrogenase